MNIYFRQRRMLALFSSNHLKYVEERFFCPNDTKFSTSWETIASDINETQAIELLKIGVN